MKVGVWIDILLPGRAFPSPSLVYLYIYSLSCTHKKDLRLILGNELYSIIIIFFIVNLLFPQIWLVRDPASCPPGPFDVSLWFLDSFCITWADWKGSISWELGSKHVYMYQSPWKCTFMICAFHVCKFYTKKTKKYWTLVTRIFFLNNGTGEQFWNYLLIYSSLSKRVDNTEDYGSEVSHCWRKVTDMRKGGPKMNPGC